MEAAISIQSLWKFDQEYYYKDKAPVGVDEVGRGPIAGPVVTAALRMPANVTIDDINDSKQLSESARLRLEKIILTEAADYAYGWATHNEIDRQNIYWATRTAMRRAISGLKDSNSVIILTDAMPLEKDHPRHQAVIKGDSKSGAIACASILAKCFRDRWMDELDRLYPGYGFAQHKGYPTKFHIEQLNRLGPCPVHRQTFGPVQKVLTHAQNH